MLLTVVLFYLTYIRVSYTLPPLANAYRYNADNLETINNERFMQHAILEEQNVGSINYQPLPTIASSHSNFNAAQINAAIASASRKLEIINQNGMTNNGRLKQQNQFRPEVNQRINVPQNYESILNNMNYRTMVSQFQGENLAKQYGIAQNFKINLRGYIAPDINKGFISPQSAPLKPFSQIRPVQRTIQPTGVNIGNNVNRQMLNLPVASLPNKEKSENAPLQSKKLYTIVHPNGSIEETDDFEYIKKNYPNYIVHDLNKQKSYTESVAEMEVHAGSPLANPTIVPIFNLPPEQPLLNMNNKETLVPNTLVPITQSQINPTKIDELTIVNATHYNANNDFASLSPVSSRNLTSQHDISKPGSQKLHTSILETLKSIKSNDSNNLPVIDKTIISPSDLIKPPKKNQDTNIESDSLHQDNVNEMLEKISATDFWKEIDVIQISDETAAADINKENLSDNFETIDSSEDGELTKNSTIKQETTQSKDLTSEDDDVNIKDTDDSYEVFNTNPEIVEDFVSSIEDRLEFIKPFLIINETDAIDKPEKNSSSSGNSLSNANTSESGQALTNPIYIPHISLVEDVDTNSSFWFTTNDEKALEKLSPHKRKNVTISSTLTNGENKTGTMYSNETKEETTFEEKKLVSEDSEEEIKNT
ncbi:uncharacterized protein LOC125056800 [Pieris napi]|uniref:uncharacterized protein LOC125056800 n=1 Tax=Pieris napi TaxID=78633 RepID=UPI001FBA2654|nr:uncharacterized protein LOC125056800 [Pieris napi]